MKPQPPEDLMAPGLRCCRWGGCEALPGVTCTSGVRTRPRGSPALPPEVLGTASPSLHQHQPFRGGVLGPAGPVPSL